ncbi:hypothetical protein DID88_007931 [Monilinia fructigena]|uniref:Uncharacterized protein n=1 Tax=Monilinia fructigena TaxID=38457 RepID=A0A395J648_9HELO|nr:hypothetical protein DID88_007931 [Monilinia fructigena]
MLASEVIVLAIVTIQKDLCNTSIKRVVQSHNVLIVEQCASLEQHTFDANAVQKKHMPKGPVRKMEMHRQMPVVAAMEPDAHAL